MPNYETDLVVLYNLCPKTHPYSLVTVMAYPKSCIYFKTPCLVSTLSALFFLTQAELDPTQFLYTNTTL